jgi:protein-disulfide isomerase
MYRPLQWILALGLLLGLGGCGAATVGPPPTIIMSTPVPPTPSAPAATIATTSGLLPNVGLSVGLATAPVTMTVYTDVDCPDCVTFVQTILVPLLDTSVRDGTLRLELHPVAALGQFSESAVQALVCAQDQDLMWPYYEVLSGLQSTQALTDDTFYQAARGAGLDMDSFVLCYSRGVHHNKAHDLTNQAIMRGIPEIPALVMNGTTILTRSAYLEDGRPSLARLQALIDAAKGN